MNKYDFAQVLVGSNQVMCLICSHETNLKKPKLSRDDMHYTEISIMDDYIWLLF